MIDSLVAKLTAVITTLPSQQAIAIAVIILVIYGILAIGFGLQSNFLQFKIISSPIKIARIILNSLFAPALLEEIVFRVLLLPAPTGDIKQITWNLALFNVLIFVIYHPLNALTFFPQGRKTFFNPIFLTLAALLGLICILTYWIGQSLWLPIVIHWLVVTIWLILFNGYEALNLDRTST